jgi:glycosyltransferase involved in cell wall biosynthesis
MPVFNGQADFLATMVSLSHSTESSDIIVVDDGSVPRLDTRGFDVHLIRFPRNQGIVAALNAGLKYALEQGYKYIARIDAGDFADAGRLARQVAYLERNSDCMLVGSDADVFAAGGEYQFTIMPPRDGKALASGLKDRVWLLHSTVVFRASIFAEVGLYSDEFEAAEDYELFLRIARKYPVAVVPHRLVSIVCGVAGISARKRKIQLVSRLRIQLRYFSWTCYQSYTGVLRTVAALMLPVRAKGWLKRNYIYPRIGDPAIGSLASESRV